MNIVSVKFFQIAWQTKSCEKYYSDKMTITFTGIEKVEGSSQAVSTEYYDLTGAKTTLEAKGIVICKTTMSDGSVKVSKQVK